MKTAMLTNTYRKRQGQKKSLFWGIWAILFALAFWGVKAFVATPTYESPKLSLAEISAHQDLVFDIETRVHRLREGFYPIDEQLRDLGIVGTAIVQRKVNSSELGESSEKNWLAPIRSRVEVRKAVEAFNELHSLAEKGKVYPLSKDDLARVSVLKKIIEPQIRSQYASEEGLNFDHGTIGVLVDRATGTTR